MSFFLTYDAENWEYHLTAPGYIALAAVMLLIQLLPALLSGKERRKMSVTAYVLCRGHGSCCFQ